jgi:histidyl-tRNA synthetase
MIKRVRGTEDIFDLQKELMLVQQMRQLLQQHNFHEIGLPLFESTDLFARSLGTSTDVVSKEMYTFSTAGGESISLRPEATASTVRAFLEAGIQERPWKVFTYGPMFRHERPQKGRWRQFNQCSIESIGTENILDDALFIRMLYYFFAQKLRLTEFVLHINWLGTIEDRERFKKKLLDFLVPFQEQICQTCQVRLTKNTLRIFDCKSDTCQKIYEQAPNLVEVLSQESRAQWELIQKTLQDLGVRYQINASLVRGLDYYSGIVFEFVSQVLGAQSAFCGGGRYELASQLEGPVVPSIGAAIGVGRLLLLQEAEQKVSEPVQENLVAVLPLSKDQQQAAIRCYTQLIDAGIAAEIVLGKSGAKALFKKADQLKVSHALIIGEQEVQTESYLLKNMATGEQVTYQLEALLDFLFKN